MLTITLSKSPGSSIGVTRGGEHIAVQRWKIEDHRTSSHQNAQGSCILTKSSLSQTIVSFQINVKQSSVSVETKTRVQSKAEERTPTTYLEIGNEPSSTVDYTQIVNQNKKNAQVKSKGVPQKERENSADFVDDLDVPPLI